MLQIAPLFIIGLVWLLVLDDSISKYVIDFAIPTCLNLISTVIILIALLSIKKFVETRSKWQWSKDGLFAIHLIFFASLTIVEAAILVQVVFG